MNAIFDIAPDPEIARRDVPRPEWPRAHAVFADGEAERIIAEYRERHCDEKMLAHYRGVLAQADAMSGSTLFATAPVEEVREILMTRPPETWIYLGEDDVSFLLALLGDAIIPRLWEIHALNKLDPLALLRIQAPEVVALAAARAVEPWSIEARLPYFVWLGRERERALPLLLHTALTSDGNERAIARAALRWLSKRDGGAALVELAKSWNVANVEPILAPLGRKLHDNITIPKSWGTIEPPRWRDGTALSKEECARLLGFFASEPHRGHPATQGILNALDSDSLRAWMTAVESVWTAKGSALTHLWLLHATCLVYGDAGVRQIGTWARNKSTSSNRNERTRSGKTVEVLLELDDDVATAQIADIAALAKADAVRRRADATLRIKMLETDQPLEAALDRTVPDLGLSAGVEFDYGPRRFSATIDARLEVVLTDSGGARLIDLPAARKADDKAKAKAAVLEWRAFKKDAAAVIDVQRKRLEHAMISGRRMTLEAFRQNVLSNPILSALAHGLVWGAWSGLKVQEFRVAEDLSFADAGDTAVEIAEGEVSVLHPLEIEEASAWHERFQDYELIQPFEQLVRATFRAEVTAEIGECSGWVASAGAVMGLLREGWKPTYPVVEGVTRSFGEDRTAHLAISPGFFPAEAASAKEQVFGALRVSRELLNDRRIEIVLSEILRDLARVRRKVAT